MLFVTRIRPSQADNVPIVGPTAVEGLVVATGHHRNGILLTPIDDRGHDRAAAVGRAPPRHTPAVSTRSATGERFTVSSPNTPPQEVGILYFPNTRCESPILPEACTSERWM